jgi:hypothetical protein
MKNNLIKIFLSYLVLFGSTIVLAKGQNTFNDFGLDQAWYAGIIDYAWPFMSFVLGLVDGFNPCAMWTLFILLGFLLPMKSARKRWLIGGVFIGSSALIYMGALLAYLFGFQTITQYLATSVMSWVFVVIGIMSIIVGGVTMFSVKNKGIDCEVRDDNSKKAFHNKLSEILNRDSIFLVLIGVMILAFSVNSLELLCSVAIPTVFTSTLISLDLATWKNFTALFIYDFAYILDDIIVFTIAIKTLSLNIFSPKLVQIANYIGALILIFLGLILIFDSEKVAIWFA